MFICNIKMNSSLAKKIIVVIVLMIIIAVFMFVGYKFYTSVSKVMVNDTIPDTSYIEINSNNYTSILKDCHDNIDKYVGKTIKFTGFVYRLYDFNENQFVLAREMIISSDNHAVVVGFLCNSTASKDFSDSSWVEVEGTITKGSYHGDIPIIEVTNMNKTSVPNDELVYPPSDSYINTEV